MKLQFGYSVESEVERIETQLKLGTDHWHINLEIRSCEAGITNSPI